MQRERLSVLWLAPFLPYPPHHGGAARIFNLLRKLASEVDIDLAALTGGAAPARDLEVLRGYCRSVQVFVRPAGIHLWPPRLAPPAVYLDDVPAMRRAVAAAQAGRGADVMQIDFPSLATYLAYRGASRTYLTEHDVTYLSLYRRFQAAHSPAGKVRALLAAATFFSYELRQLPRFDTVIAVSEVDSRALRRALPRLPVAVVPNGVDCEYFLPRPAPSGPDPALLFVGNFTHRPNVDAVLWFVAAVWPELAARWPALRFLVVGRPSPEIAALAGNRVIVTGAVPDVRPYYAEARAVVVPVRYGSGTRLKILEAFAAGVPVVSTTLGAEGIPAAPERELLLADTPAAFVEQVSRLLAGPDPAESLRRRGRRLVESRFDWAIIAGLQLALWQNRGPGLRS